MIGQTMTIDKPIRVFFVEDELTWAESLSYPLENLSKGQIKCIGIETDGFRAIETATESKPDILLVDLQLLGGINGFVVARKVLEKHPQCRVIALTKLRPYQPVRQALKRGFKGYLLKVDPIVEVINAIKYVASGGISISQKVSEYLMYNPKYEAVETLTHRELDVAKLIREGLSNPEIALRLSVNEDTVKHHVGVAIQKLGLKNRSQLSAYVTELEDYGLWSLLLESDG
jgi:NarL family two-component system response regulator LiaR